MDLIKKKTFPVASAAILAALTAFWLLNAGYTPVNEISGTVSDGIVPIKDARVRIQGANEYVTTDSLGKFILFSDSSLGHVFTVTAGKKGWYNGWTNAEVGDTNAFVILEPLPPGDNDNYMFQDPAAYCSVCHILLFDQWKTSKHAGATTNPMLLQAYNGTDVAGNPGIYPGFKLDFPSDPGDCADCHAPGAALEDPGHTDLNDVLAFSSVDTNGVYCDFCHKIGEVEINYATGVNGSISMKRPQDTSARDINIGQFDDVTSPWMGATYNEVYQKSAYCSSCHQYKNLNNVLVDDTYDAWAASDYPALGIQCQDCHMKPFPYETFASGIGGAHAVPRDSSRIYNHLFRGGTSTQMLDRSVIMSASGHMGSSQLSVNMYVTNDGAGHKLPTGVSFRNILLVISATAGLETLPLLSGPILPDFAGVGDPAAGNFADEPGKAFALVTKNGITQDAPVPNWLTTEISYDSRIPAHQTDSSLYVFDLSGLTDTSLIQIQASLIYRAVYKPWADAKGWDMREYAMADTTMNFVHVTGIGNDPRIPVAVQLRQNYPNPFNPSTTIIFSLPSPQFVDLIIYNTLGQKVQTLMSGFMTSGTHSLAWDGRNQDNVEVASGLYFYRLRTPRATQTRKMMLLR